MASVWPRIRRYSASNVRANPSIGSSLAVTTALPPSTNFFRSATSSSFVPLTSSAARSRGLNALLLSTFVEGEARQVAQVAAALAKERVAHDRPVVRPACLVWGGETTVTIRGQGKGGRNQELALAAAQALEGLAGVLLLALGTDGTDGPTDAAGAVATGETVARARTLGVDPAAYLRDNDSYHFFEALGDLLQTGPTGTNVNDLLFIFAT